MSVNACFGQLSAVNATLVINGSINKHSIALYQEVYSCTTTLLTSHELFISAIRNYEV